MDATWIDVRDALPDSDEIVLCWDAGGAWLYRYDIEERGWCAINGDEQGEVTHWCRIVGPMAKGAS